MVLVRYPVLLLRQDFQEMVEEQLRTQTVSSQLCFERSRIRRTVATSRTHEQIVSRLEWDSADEDTLEYSSLEYIYRTSYNHPIPSIVQQADRSVSQQGIHQKLTPRFERSSD